MSEKLDNKYILQIPDFIRESISEFLGNFLQIYMLTTSLVLPFIAPNTAKREYTDPEYCVLLSNNTCDSNVYIPDGKKEGTDIYDVQLEILYVIIISITWATGLMGSLLLTVPVSGGYLNPAISVTLATMSRLEWKKLWYYIPAQYCGAFFAAICFHVVFYKHMNPNNEEIIISYVLISSPHPKINMWTAILNTFVPSLIFSMFLFAILDTQTNGCPKYIQPILIFFAFIGIINGFFADTKVQLSPARDLGTRLYGALIIGFDKAFGQYGYCFWWLPQQVCIYLGFLSGGWLYQTLFGHNERKSLMKDSKYFKSNDWNQNQKKKSNQKI